METLGYSQQSEVIQLIRPSAGSLEKKHSPARSALARRLVELRRLERAGEYTIGRDANGYLNHLAGCSALFDYVRSLGTSNIVLDVGAGKTVGIAQISRSFIGRGLEFLATGLVKNPAVAYHLGFDKFRVTPVERLRGFGRSSVACVLGVFSIAYSSFPEAAMRRVDEVLVPGGAIKAVFRRQPGGKNLLTPEKFFDRTRFQTYDQFSEVLQALGYDVNVLPEHEGYDVMLAIKPGGRAKVTAYSLLLQDAADQQAAVVAAETARLARLFAPLYNPVPFSKISVFNPALTCPKLTDYSYPSINKINKIKKNGIIYSNMR